MFKEVLRDQWKILSFQFDASRLLRFGRVHLIYGLIVTWLVGIGRYWDHPNAETLQYLGVGSLLYVFGLTGFLWIVMWPLKPPHWKPEWILKFVVFCSLPAGLYAIPVEKFLSLDLSASINAWFLAVVAIYRVALLFVFLRRFAGLNILETIVGGLLPLVLIIVFLTALNLEHVTFDIMGGFRQPTSGDKAYTILVFLTLASSVLVVPLFLTYIFIAISRFRNRKAQSSG